MSGIFGIADPKRQINLTRLIQEMAQAMAHRAWFATDHTVDHDHPVAVGRIGIGLFNRTPQPVWNADQTIALVMAGEFYHQGSRNKARLKPGADEEMALALYERKGEDFASELEGVFVIAVWDKARQQLIIANDRFGLYPLFYTLQGDSFIFAPEVKGILSYGGFRRKLDLVALAQYMRFQHLLGERTFFEDISLLPPASILYYNLMTRVCKVKPYWTFANIAHRPQVTFAEAVEEVGQLFRSAVNKLSGDQYRHGVYLSGGLDSRTIIGMIARRPVASITYGAANCRDVYYARQIAKTVGSEHCWVDLPDGRWVKDQVDFHLELTEGFHSWIHAHGMSSLAQARQLMDINLTGWDGGTVMGHDDSIEAPQTKAKDKDALATRLFYLFNQEYTWPSITEAEENLLYSAPMRSKMQGLAFDSFMSELAGYLDYRPDVRGEYFYLRNHCGRLTHNFITFTRSHVEVRFPFFDYKLFDFLYSLPAHVRGHRTLYRAVIQRETPKLAYIPYAHDEFLPTTRPTHRKIHALGVKLQRRVNRHLRAVFPERPTLYADYENYLRYELRDWAESLLFAKQTEERGIFRPEALRSLMDRHLARHEVHTIGKIAPIMTFEMMMRRFFDNSTVLPAR